jgi:hypothetical protein
VEVGPVRKTWEEMTRQELLREAANVADKLAQANLDLRQAQVEAASRGEMLTPDRYYALHDRRRRLVNAQSGLQQVLARRREAPLVDLLRDARDALEGVEGEEDLCDDIDKALENLR